MWQRDFHPGSTEVEGVSNKTTEDVYESHSMSEEKVATSASIQPLNLSGVEALLRHAAQTGAIAPKGPLFGVELGNELTPRTITPATQAADYNEFRKLLDTIFPAGGAPQLFGPAADSCANMTQFLDISRPARLDAFTFHSCVQPFTCPVLLIASEILLRICLMGYVHMTTLFRFIVLLNVFCHTKLLCTLDLATTVIRDHVHNSSSHGKRRLGVSSH